MCTVACAGPRAGTNSRPMRAEPEFPLRHQSRVLIVANTHLFYHPGAPHVRLLQVACLLAHCEQLMEEHAAEAPAVLLCGDYNMG
ncbi:unnamed protein product, partial [Prorocentrum cordatum]